MRNSKVILLVVAIVGFVLGLVFNMAVNTHRYASAQVPSGASLGGVMAFTGQIDKDEYGIVMVDVDAGTLWIYQYKKPGKLKLVAARSWLYDRYLEEYNCAPPSPTDVARLVADKQRLELKDNSTLEPEGAK